MTQQQRDELARDFQRDPQNILGLSLTKAELKAFLNACDDWADTNAASFNAAIPQPARGVLTLKQKSLGLAATILKRAGLL